MCFIRLFVKLVAWHDELLFVRCNARQSYKQDAVVVREVAKLLACFTSPLADDLPFSPFFGMERFCRPPDSLQSATYTRPWVYKFAVDIDLANAAKMLRTSCYAWAPNARPLIFTWRRFGRIW